MAYFIRNVRISYTHITAKAESFRPSQLARLMRTFLFRLIKSYYDLLQKKYIKSFSNQFYDKPLLHLFLIQALHFVYLLVREHHIT